MWEVDDMSGYMARHWREDTEKNGIECDLCPRHCIIVEGHRGLCFGRKNIDGKLIATSYGKSSGFAVDPIEKKPLNHFMPSSSVLSFGTIGCNLTCSFCQNSDISKTREMERLQINALPQEIVEMARQNGCASVAFTYNEPIVFLEYAVDTAKECHGNGIKTVAVTAGYIEKEARKEFFSVMDAANIDLKGFSDNFYNKHCSASLNTVLDTLKYVKNETNTWLEITNLIIPGENDGFDEIKKMADWIAKELGTDVPLHFSAFHPAWKMTNVKRTPLDLLIMARATAMESGLKYVYTGNIHNPETEATYCNDCSNILISRDGFNAGITGLFMDRGVGRCSKCGAVCSGKY
jgi:pyruvate formate lyase activating enzyme